ncbi:protein MICROTUBULE BINDING PROTEIN 2C [Magnolia sinica]|uniref:protein MICROTUBULE BINDING PROTEIN 2C n=1 Tax=Magnolia sinica TaxID=86752 RepID=UPI002659B578|nr:protein MICROTUBULE BINDING PROTEIN 2C [Magnolia sinica]
MFEPQQQHFVDLRGNGSFGEDPNSWLSEEQRSSSSASSNAPGNNGNVDRVLFKNLVEMVPLVESLMDRRANTSFTRRASMIYTRTPSRESYPKKIGDLKGRKIAQTGPSKKRRDLGENDSSKNNNRDNQDGSVDDFSIFSSRAMALEKDKEDLIMLQKQVEDLQKKLLEKDEVLKSAENSMNQMSSVNVKLDELKRQVAEKDSLIKSAHLQLSDAKIKLADKQAALEKLQWEAMTSTRKVEKLQGDLDTMQGEISVFMEVLQTLGKTSSQSYAEEKNTYQDPLDQFEPIETVDEAEMQKMEEARKAYIAAVAAAKENPSEESLAAAAAARLKLQAFVFGPNKLK